jgi:hypothetical protein
MLIDLNQLIYQYLAPLASSQEVDEDVGGLLDQRRHLHFFAFACSWQVTVNWRGVRAKEFSVFQFSSVEPMGHFAPSPDEATPLHPTRRLFFFSVTALAIERTKRGACTQPKLAVWSSP